ncbi:uncharacterized protein LOC121379672 [Gigantopelta aegis]|uniref:uncharacterized protein LOC121379672 n=1 Tax=Gigantopelta aegis TaxID=1735272 RepID=UPI001B88D0A1|nr:uncharacterized protein LOC121379672 [Gigantopelta aegis]
MDRYSVLFALLCLLGVQGLLRLPYDCGPPYFNIPKCRDHPDGYGCACGPGFHWNTHRCMSSSIDSRFEYKAEAPARYTLLLDKAFPELTAFTMAFWVNVSSGQHPGTILSYKVGDNTNLIRMMSGPTLNFEIWGQKEDMGVELHPGEWYHVTWTWTSTNGKWHFYLNGNLQRHGFFDKVLRVIPIGGEFVLGQSSREKVTFNISTGLDGDLAHFNIWNYMMNVTEINDIMSSCKLMYCGNAVQWVDFRSGTRGAMKMRWPSGIFTGECFDEHLAARSCDVFCSDLNGAQCNLEAVENIKWKRTKASTYVEVTCPGQEENHLKNLTTDYANRSCHLLENQNDGVWDKPQIDACISDDLLELKYLVIGELDDGEINEIQVLDLAYKLLNHTEENAYTNPIDIATVIDLLEYLVTTQGVTPRTVTWLDGTKTFARTEVYPTFEQTRTFCQSVLYLAVSSLSVLYSAVSNSSVLYSAVSSSNVLYSAVSSSNVLYTAVSSSSVLYSAVSKTSVLYSVVSSSSVLYSTVSSSSVLYSAVSKTSVLYSVVSSSSVLYSTVSSSSVLYSVVKSSSVLYSEVMSSSSVLYSAVISSSVLYSLVSSSSVLYLVVSSSSVLYSSASSSGVLYSAVSSSSALYSVIIASTVNSILDTKNEVGWNATLPSGVEGDNLMRVMRQFADVISRSLKYHVIDGFISYKDAAVRVFQKNIEFKIETQWIEEFYGTRFPDGYDSRTFDVDREDGMVRIQGDAFLSNNTLKPKLPVFIGVSTFRYLRAAIVLPNNDVNSRSLENWVNTPIVALFIHKGDRPVTSNLTSPIIIDLPLLDTFNISNPECVRLQHRNGSKNWLWTTSNCEILEYGRRSVLCACSVPGVFAVTTDMYNVNWDKGDKRPVLMSFASYIGCTVSITLCGITFLAHSFLRTSSSTASLHKNLSLSIVGGQMVFMFGINRYEQKVMCQVFSILLHYFFLTNYSWMMNEAFNLYILITYSAHSASELTDSGSMVRYYVLGWVIPAVLVGAFLGTNKDDYYAPDMCWIAFDHFWLFIGPAVGIIAVSILVLIFTAKEHNENSYTKSEKTNRIILIHMKGVWTQLILVTVCWSFAFVSLKMIDAILKYLYALFNCLQGAFFIVFYVFLHEEIRAILKSRQKKRTLVTQGFDLMDDRSLDSLASYSILEKEIMVESVPLKSKAVRRKITGTHKSKSESGTTGEDGSDSEMITSV